MIRYGVRVLWAAVAFGWLWQPSQAEACGGFFCNNSQPVNQAAERILFSHNADGTTTAVIQVLYDGPSERFAWILPVQGTPEVGLSSNVVFSALQRATNPTYQLQVEFEGQCASGASSSSFGCGADDAVSRSTLDAGSAPMDPGVNVVDSGSIGPYDYVNISVDPDAENVAEVATDWLMENGYDVSELGRDRLVPYLESGMNLIAFRLSKGASAGEIRPIALSFGEGLPSIPLRATAAAAVEDMGVMVWVLGEHRAIPANYADLELNETRINWFTPGVNYNEVVALAAREAGGHGFVTEFSGDAAPFSEVIWSETLQGEWERLRASPSPYTLDGVVDLFSTFDGLEEAVLDVIPKPAAVSEEEWIARPFQSLNRLTFEERNAVDAERFLMVVGETVIDPVRDTAALFDGAAKVTRLYTTMSPEQMTVDPVFDFSPSLPDYSNVHLQTRVVECRPDVTNFEAPWRVDFGDGVVVRGSGNWWPVANDIMLPAARRVVRRGPDGGEDIRADNREAIAARLAMNNEGYPAASSDGSTCSTGWHRGKMPLLVLLVGMVGLWRRRSRR